MNTLTRIVNLLRPFVPGPGVFLLILAPVIGAVLSGLTPPSHLFNLFTLFTLCVVYGGGAIICREFMLYWGKRWPTLLLLGAAFGVVVEGLLNKSFFNPSWPYLGILATYGRVDGINWVWAVQQVIFHSVFTIVLPVLLVSLMFPNRRQERWAGPRALLILLVLFALAVVLGFFFVSSYHPPILFLLGTIVVAAVFVVLARFAPRTVTLTKRTGTTTPLRFAIVGFVGTTLFFLVNWLPPYVPFVAVPFWATIVLSLLIALVTGVALVFMSGNGRGWTDRQRVALIIGALGFFILLAPITEIFLRQRDPGGITFIALLIVGLLFLLARGINRREKRQATIQTPPMSQMTQVR